MRILLVLAHPAKNSFNRAILQTLSDELETAGHELKVKDLYAENFDPVLREADLKALNNGEVPPRIQTEQQALTWAEGIVLIYPLWWYGTPAILKGWFDCTLTYGFAFKQQGNDLEGLLKQQQALVIITAGSKQDWFESNNAEDLIIRPVTDGTLTFCGIDNIEHKVIYDLISSTEEERNTILNEIKGYSKLFKAP